jgi:hypothetical protein
MMRLAIAAILFVSVFAMMRGISTTWRQNMLSVPAVVEKTGKPVAPTTTTPAQLPPKPVVSGKLPDLKAGYLFNADRLLEEEGAQKKAENLAAGNDLGIKADIKTVIYAGSIIGENLKQAIIVVAGAKKTKTPRTRSRRKKKSSSRKGNVQNIRVKEGDLLSGYTVASISPEKIVFSKGNEKVEKLLYDPDKKRTSPSKLARSAPVPRSEVVARPAGTPSPPRTIARPTSGRRLVVPRRPPTKPNTSRVARRGRRSSSLRPPVATPPMPVMHH